jgi:hypothetical protein
METGVLLANLKKQEMVINREFIGIVNAYGVEQEEKLTENH